MATRRQHLHISDEKIKGWMDEMALRRGISLKEMQKQLIDAWEIINKTRGVKNESLPKTVTNKRRTR